jgi:hypothetical protein
VIQEAVYDAHLSLENWQGYATASDKGNGARICLIAQRMWCDCQCQGRSSTYIVILFGAMLMQFVDGYAEGMWAVFSDDSELRATSHLQNQSMHTV